MRLRVLAAMIAVTVWSPLAASAQYAPVDLGTLGGHFSFAHAINDRGQVVGRAATSSGQQHAFLWDKGVMQDLGTLPGGSFSDAYAINDLGQVVGFSSMNESTCTLYDGCWHAFLWQNGTMIDLGGLDNRFQSYAYSITNQGEIVGISATGDYPAGVWRAVRWDHGRCRAAFGASGATSTTRIRSWVRISPHSAAIEASCGKTDR